MAETGSEAPQSPAKPNLASKLWSSLKGATELMNPRLRIPIQDINPGNMAKLINSVYRDPTQEGAGKNPFNQPLYVDNILRHMEYFGESPEARMAVQKSLSELGKRGVLQVLEDEARDVVGYKVADPVKLQQIIANSKSPK